MSESGMQAKWNAHYATLDLLESRYQRQCPAQVLVEQEFLLPTAGKALDLACGLGASALFLAKHGLAVSAWDISTFAIKSLQACADEQGLAMHAKVCDIDANSFQGLHFDVIVVQHYLDRKLIPALLAALNPGGLVFYQTFTQEKACAQGPKNSAYLLAPGELLRLFSSLQLCFYREYALVGDVTKGLRNEAQFVGVKAVRALI